MKYLIVSLVILATLTAGCAAEKTTPAPSPSPTPDIESIVRTRVQATAQALLAKLPEATPTPRLARDTILDFARSHQRIETEWEAFHADFDTWRQGLTSCDASAMQDFLRGFAGRFTTLTEQARALSRDAIVQEVADAVIGALDREGKALRQLRDTWRPDASAPFELVEKERASTSSARRAAERNLDDLKVRASPSGRAQVKAFAQSVSELNKKWEEFHRSYETFRRDEPGLAKAEASRLLSQLVTQYLDIVTAVRDLPSFEITRPVAKFLAQAAEDQDLALRKLRNFFQEGSTSSDQQPPPTPSTGPKPGPTPPPSLAPEPSPSPFLDFDTQVVKSNALRRQATQELADIQADISEESQLAVERFSTGYGPLAKAWDAVHQEYDAWRPTEGGCNRSEAIKTLGRFVPRFAALTNRVRELPRVTQIRPLGELLIEAAERQEKALRDLRDVWRPFGADVYKAFDQERNGASKLRRQVVAGLNDLLSQYGISPQELR